jgi:hypothetical protein
VIGSERARDFVQRGARIRVHSGALGHHEMAMAEGHVVAYCAAPTLTIQHDDGSRSTWSVDLPIEEVEPPTPRSEQEFSRAVARERLRRGWSQDRLVEELSKGGGLKIHQTGITRIEAGTRRVRLDEAIAIARVLDIDLQLGGERA